jgi:NAD(P)-dependent dehydrogenase (short-subunit alcohol dehydrogenase family)
MIKERFELTDKVALVLGGRGVLGSSFSAAFEEFGAQVYSADLQTSSEQSADLKRDNIIQLNVDVTNASSIIKLVEDVKADAKRIDILVYSVTAKPNDFYKPFTECSLEGWQTVLRTELDGLFLISREVGKMMEESGSGSMIFLSSIYGVVGNNQNIYEGSNLADVYLKDKPDGTSRVYSHAVYAAAKGAVISLTRFLAAYWGDKNIRVNCISPGGLSHPGENEEFVKRYSEKAPLGRKARVEEITGAAVFLASDASTYVTGHNLIVDGGWTIW